MSAMMSLGLLPEYEKVLRKEKKSGRFMAGGLLWVGEVKVCASRGGWGGL